MKMKPSSFINACFNNLLVCLCAIAILLMVCVAFSFFAGQSVVLPNNLFSIVYTTGANGSFYTTVHWPQGFFALVIRASACIAIASALILPMLRAKKSRES